MARTLQARYEPILTREAASAYVPGHQLKDSRQLTVALHQGWQSDCESARAMSFEAART